MSISLARPCKDELVGDDICTLATEFKLCNSEVSHWQDLANVSLSLMIFAPMPQIYRRAMVSVSLATPRKDELVNNDTCTLAIESEVCNGEWLNDQDLRRCACL